jgi:hypothetical protein
LRAGSCLRIRGGRGAALQFGDHPVDEVVEAARTYGNMMLNPSQASLKSHSCIRSAIISGVPIIERPP